MGSEEANNGSERPRISAADLRYKYNLCFQVPEQDRESYFHAVIGDIVLWIEQYERDQTPTFIPAGATETEKQS